MTKVTAADYAGIFIVLLLLWPFLLFHSPWICAGTFIFNTILLLLVIVSTNSEELSFWQGIKYISAQYMSGCANITLIYIFWVLTLHYLRAVVATGLRPFRGKQFTEAWWIETVDNSVPNPIEESVAAQTLFAVLGLFLSLSGVTTILGVGLNFFSRLFGLSLGLNLTMSLSSLLLSGLLGIIALTSGILILKSTFRRFKELRRDQKRDSK